MTKYTFRTYKIYPGKIDTLEIHDIPDVFLEEEGCVRLCTADVYQYKILREKLQKLQDDLFGYYVKKAEDDARISALMEECEKAQKDLL